MPKVSIQKEFIPGHQKSSKTGSRDDLFLYRENLGKKAVIIPGFQWKIGSENTKKLYRPNKNASPSVFQTYHK